MRERRLRWNRFRLARRILSGATKTAPQPHDNALGAATMASAQHAFKSLDLSAVEIHAATGNLRSRKLAERLGLRAVVLREQAEWLYDRYVDHVVYELARP